MQFEDFQRLILALDHEGIESARDRVTPADVPALCRWYFELEGWEQRCALVDLLVDQSSPELDAVCKDVLRAPGSGDWVELPKAFALGWLAGRGDLFMAYYNDRGALQRAVDAKLQELGLPPVVRPEPVAMASTSLPDDVEQALWLAATSGRHADVEALLQRGASPNLARDGEPLSLAAMLAGHVRCALTLVRGGADPSARRVTAQQPLLWWAAGKGSAELVELLLRRGAAIEASDRWGTTALLQASSAGHAEVVACLLTAGANVHQRAYDGRTALSFSVRGGKPRVLSLLLDAGADLQSPQPTFTPLAAACFEGTTEMVELLLERGASPNALVDYMNYRGTTPLMFAAQKGVVAMVEALLRQGANKATRDRDGRTPADYASGRNAEQIRRLLF